MVARHIETHNYQKSVPQSISLSRGTTNLNCYVVDLVPMYQCGVFISSFQLEYIGLVPDRNPCLSC